MIITEVHENKKRFLPLLLLGDEQESMVDQYLDRGTMYILDDGGVKAQCVITDEGNGLLEIKNIAVIPECQGQGYGRALIEFIIAQYQERFTTLQACTGDSPLTIPFYEHCGFMQVRRVKNYFLDNYDHDIFEAGVQLIDLVCLQRKL